MCQYAGEVITTTKARRRLAEYDRELAGQPGHALLVGLSLLDINDKAC